MYKGRRWLFCWSRLIVLVVAVLLARICGQSPLEAVCFLKAAKHLCRSAARPGVMDAWAAANAALESPDPPCEAQMLSWHGAPLQEAARTDQNTKNWWPRRTATHHIRWVCL